MSGSAATAGSTDETFGDALGRWGDAWERFWFTPTRPHTLCVLRILTGAMLLYCHVVLASDLLAFVGPDAWMSNDMARQLHDGAFGTSDWARSYLWYFDSPTVIWLHHGVTLLVTAMYMIGLGTRITIPLALFFQLMYLHRLTGALFGLDQIVTYTTMYLALTPCGSRFSVDALIRKRWVDKCATSAFWRFMLPDDSPSIAANIGTRLLQLHLCVIYLFGGLSKARGETWWNGTAVWYAVSNYEYQSMDMTWISRYPAIISALSNATLFWEVFYCALVWPRVTRPFVLAVAVGVHASIAIFLGMITFGSMMIFANGIFLSPRLFQSKAQRQADDETAALIENDEVADVEAAEQELTQQLQNPDLSASERARLKEKRDKIRAAAARVKRRYRALKKREEKYEARVKKLREREAKIKTIVQKRRERKSQDDGDSTIE
ncbi:HTTM domain-containing protein [Stieleria sp. ICT_E10.1]|uniref:HTTM domain-containing protein n=1 Tax=Stieleria sedimenti TaxID=2976331 RepID=UPI0021804BBD|nr:HTTM domain-containing protein [Stieleria sedimenti]MCS7471225.1 HTTM domain-containing protein [Stieleria sedimenti]